MACDSVNKVFHEGLGSAKSDIETVAGIRRVTVDKLDCVEKLEDWVAEDKHERKHHDAEDMNPKPVTCSCLQAPFCLFLPTVKL